MTSALAPIVTYGVTAFVLDHANERQWEQTKCGRVALNLSIQFALSLWSGNIGPAEPNDDIVSLFLRIAVAAAVLDVLFGGVHRLFHAVPLLWEIHREHHSMPSADLAAYETFFCNPIEHIACNLFPVALSAWVSGMSNSLAVVFFCYATYGSVSAHSARDSYHFVHHAKPDSHYGLGGLFTQWVEECMLA